MRVFMSGGGTAGHVYPALAVAARFAAERDEVLFVGTPTGLESRLVPESGVEFRGLHATGFDRSRPWTLLSAAARGAWSAARAWTWLGACRPDVVVGFGGYVSIPVGLAAAMRGIPIVLHEQNSVPGMANRLLARWARAIAITYEESAPLLCGAEGVTVTGNPVRDRVLRGDRVRGRAELGVPGEARMLLVFGGSRGARHLNEALLALRDRLLALDGLVVVHIAGPAEAPAVSAALELAGGDAGGRWRVLEYVTEMGDALAAADLVLARAGATSIAEITALGVPALLVPYPYATDDHQTRNADTVVAHGAAVRIADGDLDGEPFAQQLIGLLEDERRRATMAAASRALGRAHAADAVADLVRRIADAHRRSRVRSTDS